ncbi:hypothetical protein [Salinibius halmophilus]|uniref:hypothetical protein n=1 Tax=Salinibius halmophilus TaxID=1853216 RepID=UPI000E674E7F|nr:hypothetical protein [Salinibius halmophilus]
MQIEQFRLDAKPRTGWQTLDLGVQLAKQNYWALFLWFMLPALAVGTLVSWLWTPMAGYLVAWWLKPLWERPGMLILSERIFNGHTPARTRLKSLHKIYGQQIFASLLWRRFSPTRTFDMPVMLLEGLKGKRRSQRLRQLHGNVFGQSAWWLLLLVNLEFAVMIAASSAVWLLLPQGLQPDFDLYFVLTDQYEMLSSFAFLVAAGLIAPFFIAGGFALYIQQRIHLDCWDVQIAFSRMANRAKARNATTLSALFLAGALLMPTQDSHATELSEAKDVVEQVLESDEFTSTQTFWYPDFSRLGIDILDWFEFNDQSNTDLPNLSGLALVVEILLWLVLAALIIWAGYWLLKKIPYGKRRQLAKAQVNQTASTWHQFDWPALRAGGNPRALLQALRLLANQNLQANVPLSHCLTETELAKHGIDKAQQFWLTELAKQIEQVAWAQQMSEQQAIDNLLQHSPWEVK